MVESMKERQEKRRTWWRRQGGESRGFEGFGFSVSLQRLLLRGLGAKARGGGETRPPCFSPIESIKVEKLVALRAHVRNDAR